MIIQLNMADCDLVEIPKDLSLLSKIEEINLNSNTFNDFKVTIISLKTIPNLKRLCLNLCNNEEVNFVLDNIPHLTMLNNQDVTPEDLNEVKKRKEEFSESAIITNPQEELINTLPKPLTDHPEYPPPNTFDNNEGLLIELLNFQPIQLSQFELTDEAINIIREVYKNICNYAKNSNNSERQINILEEFEEIKNRAFEVMNKKSSTTLPAKNASRILLVSTLIEFSFRKFIQVISKNDNEIGLIITSLFQNLLGMMKGLISQAFECITQKEYELLNKKTNDVIDTAESLEKSIDKLKSENDLLKSKYKDKCKKLKSKIQQLEGILVKPPKDGDPVLLYMVKSESEKEPIQKINEVKKERTDYNTPPRTNSASTPLNNYGPEKQLTIKQTKDIIIDIFEQKKKFDEKCFEAKIPRQTMQQYLYTFLNQRYGLKTLITDWGNTILNSVGKYKVDDIDIALFDKILNNECDEEYRFVLIQLKNAMSEILKEILKQKFKTKSDSEILKMLVKIQAGIIPEPFWKESLKMIYNTLHYKIIEIKIQEEIKRKKSQNRFNLIKGNQKKMQSDDVLSYVEFEKIVVQFQLESHTQYIKKFVDLFKMIDLNNDGVISKNEFMQMMQSINSNLNIPETTLAELIKKADPLNMDQISFSECVLLLLLEKINRAKSTDSSLSILEAYLSSI